MSDPVYKVGTVQTTAEETAGFMFQNTTPKVTSKKDEGPDHRGNLKVRQYFDHRLECTLEAIIPRGVAVPVPGQTVELEGIAVPTMAADGTVDSGEFSIADEDVAGSGSGAGGTLEMTVDECEITANEEKLTRCTLAVSRGLQNGVPGLGSGSGA